MMRPKTKAAYKLFHEGLLALRDVEANGIFIDTEYCERSIVQTADQRDAVLAKLKQTKLWRVWKKAWGKKAKPSANDQLADVLFNRMGIKSVKDTPSGAPSVDIDSLTQLEMPDVDLVLEYRRLSKAGSTFLAGIYRETVRGVLHPTFDLHTARTYRSSSSDPNFQNIPVRDPEIGKLIRTAFIPRPGRQLVELDYAGVEVRGAYCYHKDPVMREYLLDPSKDMHTDMAAQCYRLPTSQVTKSVRYCGKNMFVFPEFYGSYYAERARQLWDAITRMKLKTKDGVDLRQHLKDEGIRTYEKFVDHLEDVEEDFWGRRFKVYSEWKDAWYELYCKRGWLDMLTGFRCSGVMKRNEVINYPIQGSSFHCLLWSLIELNKELKRRKMKSLIVGQIHDSIVNDVVPDELEDFLALAQDICCRRLREAWDWIIIPFEIEAEVAPVDASWHEKKEVELPKTA